MTNEQLDEIEKLADGWHRTGLTQYAEEVADNGRALVKALREARSLKQQWASDADAKEALLQSVAKVCRGMKEPDEADLSVLGNVLRERDEARAEVQRLRAVVRQIHGLAAEAVAGTAVGAWLVMQEIHKLTKKTEEG